MDTEQRAIRAGILKEDPIFREVMDGLREAAITAWTQTKAEDAKQREYSWMMVKAIGAIEMQLQSLVDGWHLSKAQSVRVPD